MKLENFLVKYTSFSKKDINKLIFEKLVKVNDEEAQAGMLIDKAKELEIKINNQTIILNGKIYVMLNKPQNYVCANKDNVHKTIFELLQNKNLKLERLFTIGRLDIDTEGLILITNDGQLTHRLTSPKWQIEKKYYVELDADIPSHLTQLFLDGIKVSNDFIAKSATLEIISPKSCYLTVREGKFHQVKRMFKAVDLNVLFLKRVKFANLDLDKNLKIGDSRHLTNAEIELLKNACNLI